MVPELNSAGDGISEGLLAFKGRTEGGVSGRRGGAKEVGGEVNELSVSKMERVSFKKEVDGYQVSMSCRGVGKPCPQKVGPTQGDTVEWGGEGGEQTHLEKYRHPLLRLIHQAYFLHSRQAGQWQLPSMENSLVV